MASFVGIDLGTTFSAIAVIDQTGRPTIVHNEDGENITPSCVAETRDGVAEVGEFARREWCIAPERAAARFKREMGTDTTYNINGNTLTPTDLSALVLKKLQQFTEEIHGPIHEAVVTVPANFSNEAREATVAAAQAAGLNVNHVINEPTAAALYYAFKSGVDLAGNYAVYDLGGGTFDVSIIQVNGHDVEVLATNGVSKLGGDDFDRIMLELVTGKFKEQTGEECDPEDFTMNDAEEHKKSLSKRDKVTTRVARTNITVTREEFEAAISSLIAQTEMLCESTIDDAGINPEDVQAVFLAGGSTRMPSVRDSVARVFGQEPTATVNPDEVVALGAALYAAYKGDQEVLSPTQRKSIEKIKIRECATYCFGTIAQTYNEVTGEAALKNFVLIPKGTPIPCSVTQDDYMTVSDGQDELSCSVTQSANQESDPRFVKIVKEATLKLPPNRPRGQRIKITFSYAEDGRMSAEFEDVATGDSKEISLTFASASETATGIDKFVVE